MAPKLFSMVALCAVLSALVGAAVAHAPAGASNFIISGRVYCDTCRAGFETTATTYIQGAKVRLECRHEDSFEMKHKVDGVTDATGSYRLEAADDHEDEICEVVLVESPLPECSEMKTSRARARVLLTQNAGIANNVRYANALAFLKSDPLPICGELLKQYHLGEDEV